MSDRPRPRRPGSRPPLWLVEGLDIAQQRRSLLLSVVLGTVVVGAVLAVVAPGIVPPSPIVGAAVAFAALLLGLAAAVAMDATDLRLRGPRHVGAAGGELVAVLPVEASVHEARSLAAAVLDAREDDAPLLLGLAASGRDARHTAAWTEALGRALVDEQVSVLNIDLASGRSEPPGLVEVVRDGVRLSEAVSFEPGARLARIGAGDDHVGALASLATLPDRLPRDLDVLLVSLPTAASRQVVDAVHSLDHVLIVAERDATSRVDLIAGLDALDAAGTRAQVALLDDRTASRLTPRRTPTPAFTASEPVGDDGGPPTDDAGSPVEPTRLDDALVAEEEGSSRAEPGTGDDERGEDERGEDERDATERDATERDDSRADERHGTTSSAVAAGPTTVLGTGAGAVGAVRVDADVVGADVPGDAAPADDPQTAAVEPVADGAPEAEPGGDLEPAGEVGPAAEDEPAEDDEAAAEPDDHAVRRREVEVLLGAAEANAIAITESGPPSAPEVSGRRGAVAPPVTRAPAVPETPSPVELDASSTTPTAGDPTAGEESTDELPRAGDPDPIREADDQQEEMLHTTARLSILMEDLDQRDEPGNAGRP